MPLLPPHSLLFPHSPSGTHYLPLPQFPRGTHSRFYTTGCFCPLDNNQHIKHCLHFRTARNPNCVPFSTQVELVMPSVNTIQWNGDTVLHQCVSEKRWIGSTRHVQFFDTSRNSALSLALNMQQCLPIMLVVVMAQSASASITFYNPFIHAMNGNISLHAFSA